MSATRPARCPQNHIIPSNKVACPECAARRNEEGVLDAQAEYLRKSAAQEHGYWLYLTKDSHKHVLLFPPSLRRSFCGVRVRQRPDASHEYLNAEILAKVCAGCRKEIERIVGRM